jgi:hypothetical protein
LVMQGRAWLIQGALPTKLTKARSARRRSWGWAPHANIGKGGLVTTVRRWLGGGIHGDTQVLLLLHLLCKLVVVYLRRHIGHLSRLHLEVAKLLLWLDHAHVDILLVGRCNLLLLLLQNLDLLCDGELFHHQRRQLRRAASVRNVQTATCRAHGALLALLLLHSR